MKTTLRIQLISLAFPLLIAVYPTLFLYSVNAWALQPGSLALPLGLSLLVAVAAFGLFLLLERSAVSAGLSAALFMVVYFLYGQLYRGLLGLDILRIQHFSFLPIVITLAVYAGCFTTRIKRPLAAQINKILTVVVMLLVSYNLLVILSVEIKRDWLKASTASAAPPETITPALPPTAGMTPAPRPITPLGINPPPVSPQKYPDIYYIIFDEYAGFDAVREYWHDDYVNAFQDFLTRNHFFVANGSRSVTINTETELSSRLNLHQYTENDDPRAVLQRLDNNKVMAIVKYYGYTTVAMDMAFNSILADQNTQFDPQQVGGMASDDFKQTFLNDTMFMAFNEYFNYGSTAEKQRDMVFFALNKTTTLSTVKSPKFVFTHVLMPHMPFIFDQNGGLIDPSHAYDWNYYLGQHKYTTLLAENLITRLLDNADPANPPVIIVQSDHGARNLASRSTDNVILDGYLQNYPLKYAHYILNALYLPGYNTQTLSNDMPPIDTFVIVLNHYLNAGVSVQP